MDETPDLYARAMELLDYDPETGELLWRTTRGTRAKRGDVAGAINSNGYIIVTIDSKKYMGHYLAWLMYYQEWPPYRLKLVTACEKGLTPEQTTFRRQDIRIENIVPAEKLLSKKPDAARQRKYASERIRRRQLMTMKRNAEESSRFTNVIWDEPTSLWIVYAMSDEPLKPGKEPSKLLGFPKKADAEEFAYHMHNNIAQIVTPNGQPASPPILKNAEAALHAGVLGPTLLEIVDELAYDAFNGQIFWRKGDKRGTPATQPTTGRTNYVQFHGWKLPAHSLAWFMAHREWPNRRTLHPRNGNWRDISLVNLFYTPYEAAVS